MSWSVLAWAFIVLDVGFLLILFGLQFRDTFLADTSDLTLEEKVNIAKQAAKQVSVEIAKERDRERRREALAKLPWYRRWGTPPGGPIEPTKPWPRSMMEDDSVTHNHPVDQKSPPIRMKRIREFAAVPDVANQSIPFTVRGHKGAESFSAGPLVNIRGSIVDLQTGKVFDDTLDEIRHVHYCQNGENTKEGFYFEDETNNYNGPYDTGAEALAALIEYAKTV